MAALPAKALIIDDDPDFANYVRTLLEHEGHRVFVATEGAEGLRTALLEQPAVILVDLLMAPQDGFTICDELRRRPETRDAGILVVTAIRRKLHLSYASPEIGPRLDVDGFLEKPFEREDLVRAFDQVLQLARSRKGLAKEVP